MQVAVDTNPYWGVDKYPTVQKLPYRRGICIPISELSEDPTKSRHLETRNRDQ